MAKIATLFLRKEPSKEMAFSSLLPYPIYCFKQLIFPICIFYARFYRKNVQVFKCMPIDHAVKPFLYRGFHSAFSLHMWTGKGQSSQFAEGKSLPFPPTDFNSSKASPSLFDSNFKLTPLTDLGILMLHPARVRTQSCYCL